MNLKPNSILFSPKRAFPKWLWDACLLALLIPVYLGHFPPETVNALQPLILATSLSAYGVLALKIYIWDSHTLRELLGKGTLWGAALPGGHQSCPAACGSWYRFQRKSLLFKLLFAGIQCKRSGL